MGILGGLNIVSVSRLKRTLRLVNAEFLEVKETEGEGGGDGERG